jgi:hypothetical protein
LTSVNQNDTKIQNNNNNLKQEFFLNFNEKQIRTHSQTSRKSLPIHTNTSDSSIWKVCIALPPAITPRKLENA